MSRGDGKYPVRTRFGAMLAAGDVHGVDGGLGTGLSAASPVLFTYDRWVLTADGAQTKTLTYLPRDGSVHVHLNGVGLDETVDYDLDAETLTVHTAAAALTDDILWARYAYDADEPVTVPESVDGLADTFERADGIADVAARSDGGLWILSSAVEPVGDDDRWEISDGKLLKLTDGFYTNDGLGHEWLHWAKGDYGDLDQITIVAGIYAPDSFGAVWISFGNDGPGNLLTGGVDVSLTPYEEHALITNPGGGYLYNTVFTIPNWEDGLVHPLTITYDRVSGHLTVDFDGTTFYDDDSGVFLTGTWLGIGSDKVGNGVAYVNVTAGI